MAIHILYLSAEIRRRQHRLIRTFDGGYRGRQDAAIINAITMAKSLKSQLHCAEISLRLTVLTDCIYSPQKNTEYSTSIQKKQHRQAAREARIPINAGRLYK